MKSAIYLIRSVGKVKIGFSNNPWKRYRQLCTGCPAPMVLAATYYCNDAPNLERQLHEQFKDRREQGEWFRVSVEEVLIAIANRGLELGLSELLTLEEVEAEKDALDPQRRWRDFWNEEEHGPMPESRHKATPEQKVVIEKFFREWTDEEKEEAVEQFLIDMKKMLDDEK